MPTTREGEKVDIYGTNKTAPYGTLVMGTDPNGSARFFAVGSNGYVKLDISDIQIGAVEIKDAITNNRVSVDSEGNLAVTSNGCVVSEENSTTTPLKANETFLGSAVEVLHFNWMTILVYSDVASADKGLVMQVSSDGNTWYDGEAYTINAGTTKFFTPPVQGKYVRLKYVNGTNAQTKFLLHTILKKGSIKSSSHNLTDNLDDGDDAILNLSVLKLRTSQDNYITGAATSAGNFKISLEEFENDISTNLNTQLNVSPFLKDEIGSYSHFFGDVFFKGAPIIITPVYYKIHSGENYFSGSAVNLSLNDVAQFTFQTPNTSKQIHFTFNISSESEMLWEIYEGGTINSPLVNEIISINNNRNSTNTSDVVIRTELHDSLAAANASVDINGATLLRSGISGSGKDSGIVVREDKIILKQNTVYVYRATAVSAGYLNYLMCWYEHIKEN